MLHRTVARLPFNSFAADFWRLMARRPENSFITLHKIKLRFEWKEIKPFRIAPMKPVPVPSQYSIRATISSLLRHGDASLQHTAQRLGISPRSLQRHLTGLGTSYSEIVAEVRLDTACHLLAESDQRISNIAQSLGYSGASSFSRIFMRLMKVQPITYRRQQIAQRKERCCGGNEQSAPSPKPDMAE